MNIKMLPIMNFFCVPIMNIKNVANNEHVECRQPNAAKLGNLQYGNLYNLEICTKWKCV